MLPLSRPDFFREIVIDARFFADGAHVIYYHECIYNKRQKDR